MVTLKSQSESVKIKIYFQITDKVIDKPVTAHQLATEKILPSNDKILPANETYGSVPCGPPMADVKDPYSYHKQSKIPPEPIKLKLNLKSRKLVKDNFGRRSNSPKKIIPGSRDHVAQILTPKTKVTQEVSEVSFPRLLIGW